ncbi:hypothetical protein [Yersinia ruckeri]|uniref:hypothetical protein n=1 Tax=Yersinia ruckeri TaxID=29486 RepID=UPI002237D10B|nr:hypothetical protein [Yersinia ruckeri]MCW6598639.1 hypothetical protein [Yersinia ruckeri]
MQNLSIEQQEFLDFNLKTHNFQACLEKYSYPELCQIAETNYHYDRSGEQEPYLSDDAFDNLVKHIVEQFNPNFQKHLDSLTYKDTFQLPVAMPGITQMYNAADLQSWLKDALNTNQAAGQVTILKTAKQDGISAELVYVNGQLKQAFSKYNGFEGKDIYRNASSCPNVPQTIATSNPRIVIRGEFEMKNSTFAEKYAQDWKNPRNMVAGLFRRKQASEELTDVSFIAYEICEDANNEFQLSRTHQLNSLDEFGFETPYRLITSYSESQVADAKVMDQEIEVLQNGISMIKSEEMGLDYALDGWVLEVDNIRVATAMGLESDGLYRHARRKFKLNFEEDAVETEVLGVEWRLHKDGQFRGRAVLEPVEICGVTVTHASIFNAYYVKHGRLRAETWKPEHPIGKGAKVRIIRSGDVIPDIVEVTVPAAEPDLPREEDWGPIGWDENYVHMITLNPDHPVVRFRKIVRFFALLNTENFGIPTMYTLFQNGWDTIEKVLDLTLGNIDKLAELEGFGEIRRRNIQEAVRAATSNIWYPNLLAGVDCFGRAVGIKRLQIVYNEWGDDCMAWEGYSEDDIYGNVKGLTLFGDITSRSFAKGVPLFLDFMKSCGKYLTIQPYTKVEITSVSNKLEGQKVVFTGFRDDALEVRIKEHGGEIGTWTNSTIVVAKDTSIVRPKIQNLIDKGARFVNKGVFEQELN